MAAISLTRPVMTFLAAIILTGKSHAAALPDEWAAIRSPSQSLNGQSIGNYSAGCIGGAMALPLSGNGYQVMRISRNRYYGHASLIQFIQKLGQAVADERLGTLLVGDLGQPRGGPTPSGHRSHQTGLDADIWFLLANPPNSRLPTEEERETWNAPSMLEADSDRLNPRHWTQAQERTLQTAALQPEVDRIFVNPSIKRELCKHKAASSEEWLRKIRPWWKHDDHFHVRLKCPQDNPHCKGQDPLPEGDGCDAGLAWWFSEEAKKPTKKQAPAPIILPALCEQIKNDAAAE